MQRSVALTQVTEWNDGRRRRVQDALAGEEPLEIRVAGQPFAVTMRTPGHDSELAAGLLFSEGVIQKQEQVRSLVEVPADADRALGNAVSIELAPEVSFDPEARKNFFVNSSCGVCGKSSIDEVRSRMLRAPTEKFAISNNILLSLPEKLSNSQQIFDRTGGLHAAGLFAADGALVVAREDIGRHNAIDKIIGWALAHGKLPLSDFAMVVSGRCGFEIAQKAILAGLPLVASVSAPSSLAVQLARELNLTLVGFLRGRRFVAYSAEQRLELVDSSRG